METPFILSTFFAVLVVLVNVALIIGFFVLLKYVSDIRAETATKKPLPLLRKKYEKAKMINPDEMAGVLKEILYSEWEKDRYVYNGSSEEFQEMLKKKYAKWLSETDIKVPDFEIRTVQTGEDVKQ